MIDKLYSDFIDAWNAGERPRVADYLDRADPAERDDLAERLEDWLLMAPTPDYTPQALAEIRAEPAFAAAMAEIDAEGPWPEALPRLRERAGLKLRDLAARITSTFGLSGQEDRAAAYLERMERGELDATGVSRRLLDALGDALGVTGEALGGMRPAAAPGSALFRAEAEPAASVEEDLEVLARAAMAPARQPMDELDRLFLGGPDA
jgi:transcriptional regulator with XRE-family HTH domain